MITVCQLLRLQCMYDELQNGGSAKCFRQMAFGHALWKLRTSSFLQCFMIFLFKSYFCVTGTKIFLTVKRNRQPES